MILSLSTSAARTSSLNTDASNSDWLPAFFRNSGSFRLTARRRLGLATPNLSSCGLARSRAFSGCRFSSCRDPGLSDGALGGPSRRWRAHDYAHRGDKLLGQAKLARHLFRRRHSVRDSVGLHGGIINLIPSASIQNSGHRECGTHPLMPCRLECANTSAEI